MMGYLSLYVFSSISLCFTIFLAKRNFAISKYRNRIYIYLASTTLILLTLEFATTLIESSNSAALVIPHIIINIAGFSLSPFVPFIFLFFLKSNIKKRFYYGIVAIPLYINAMVCIASYKTGWIFSVDSNNQYIRGNSFLLPTLVFAIYYFIVFMTIIGNRNEYEKSDKVIIVGIYSLPIFAIVIQILFSDALLIWGSVSISILLYYIYICDMQFTYDIQTGIKNRAAFQKEMEKYEKANEAVTIFVFDINNLKETNDTFGHKVGDLMIFDTAMLIKDTFAEVGKTYRIGGDEFCVLCKETNKAVVEGLLLHTNDFLVKLNFNRENSIWLSYGYAIYDESLNENMYSLFSRADNEMYIHKAKLKGNYPAK
jgi:diguanylate cyclase (GGDEF)-like protein